MFSSLKKKKTSSFIFVGSILGGSEYLQTLCAMEKQSPDLDGSALFSDQRLVANGFKIKISPGGTCLQCFIVCPNF